MSVEKESKETISHPHITNIHKTSFEKTSIFNLVKHTKITGNLFNFDLQNRPNLLQTSIQLISEIS